MNFIEFQSEQKLRGGYYTPLDLAAYIAKWVIQAQPKRILEPSCGDGAFLRAFAGIEKSLSLEFDAFELNKEEAAKAKVSGQQLKGAAVNVRAEDFLGWALKGMESHRSHYDAVVGNPPFIRYQYLPEIFQARAEMVFRRAGLPFTKHTNAWVPFVIASIAMLKPGGRLGMVLPSEIVHVMHAQALRSYLGSTCDRLLLIDPEELWFENTLQGAVILLAEKKEIPSQKARGLAIVRVTGKRFLGQDPGKLFDSAKRINGKTVEGKWSKALLSASERELIAEVEERSMVHRFDSIATVDVGIVTGANKFFLVDDAVVKEYKLEKYAYPMFGRSEHCPGVIYDQEQHDQNSSAGYPTNFLWLKPDEKITSKKVQQYIAIGESQGLQNRYKCRIRKPWYSVPSVHATDVAMLKRSHDCPRLVLNKLNAFTTDTAYRIRVLQGSAGQMVYCFLNPLTALSAELEGRHYGGGVLELVPSEIERLLVPLPAISRPPLRALDSMVRNQKIDSVLEKQSEVVLGAIGLIGAQQADVLAAWQRLRNRRHRSGGDTLVDTD